jgi:erythromycin esterase-like protein
MVNIGQLLRQRHPEEVLTGFTSYSGSVTAAQAWGKPEETMTVPAAGTGSHEDLLKQVLPEPALLMFDRDPSGTSLNTPRGHRAIGVVYDPRHESGNYVPTQMGRLATHFDAGMPVPADRRPFTRSWPPRSMAGPQARHWAQVAAT